MFFELWLLFVGTTVFALPAGVQQNSLSTFLNSKLESLKNQEASIESIFYPPTRETAILEQEPILSKKDSFFENIQNLIAKKLNLQPVVDTTREEDKYGNEAANYRNLVTKTFAVIDEISRMINVAIEIPAQKVNNIIKGARSALNVLGAKTANL